MKILTAFSFISLFAINFAFASFDQDCLDDMVFGQSRIIDARNVLNAGSHDVKLIFGAANVYSSDLNTLNQIFSQLDDRNITISDVLHIGDNKYYTVVSFRAGDNSFAYIYNENDQIVAHMIDGVCE